MYTCPVFTEDHHPLILTGLECVRSVSSATHHCQWSVLWPAPLYDDLGNVGIACVCVFPTQDGRNQWDGLDTGSCGCQGLVGSARRGPTRLWEVLLPFSMDTWRAGHAIPKQDFIALSGWLSLKFFELVRWTLSERHVCSLALVPGGQAPCVQGRWRWPYPSPPQGDPW